MWSLLQWKQNPANINGKLVGHVLVSFVEHVEQDDRGAEKDEWLILKNQFMKNWVLVKIY